MYKMIYGFLLCFLFISTSHGSLFSREEPLSERAEVYRGFEDVFPLSLPSSLPSCMEDFSDYYAYSPSVREDVPPEEGESGMLSRFYGVILSFLLPESNEHDD